MIERPLRLLSIGTLLALAACAGSTGSADLSPAAPPSQQSAIAPAPPPQEAMTPEKAKADCWMKYESDKKVKNIDQRLTRVEKCVDDTMRNQLVQRPQR